MSPHHEDVLRSFAIRVHSAGNGLAKGSSAAHGGEDQRWALQRIRTVIGRNSGLTCSIAGVWRLLHRHTRGGAPTAGART
ncbi:helix-turn-helix domain-containing protein [Streptomyces sp. DSM 40750]|uniref:helix-turn-helix domain-containing protein n=1 Tax=Streptomyces sp. DSM 40750 TaxID=2801030 RepID=UPI003FA70BB3